MLRVTLSEIFRCEPDHEAYVIMSEFPRMVAFWTERGARLKERTSFQNFRAKFIEEWRKLFQEFHSQYAQTSCMVAFSAGGFSKPSDERVRVGLAEREFAVVSQNILRLSGGALHFPVKICGPAARAVLKPGCGMQREILEQAENGKWRLGQAIVTPGWTVVAFTRFINLGLKEDPCISSLVSKCNLHF
jgi:hypothetical protein